MKMEDSGTIVITGASGLLGTHLRYRLHALPCRWNVISLDHGQFNDDVRLRDALASADAVIHCAGINRDEDAALERGNERLAQRLVDMLRQTSSTSYLCYANSIQCHADNPYGRGKMAAHRIFHDWSQSTNVTYCELVLPHIFGEGGRPYYNSAVSTFCHQLSIGESLSINGKGALELIHAQDVVATIIDALECTRAGTLRVRGKPMSVAGVAGKLIEMHASYINDVIPDLRNVFDLHLFNTLRSYMFPDFYPRSLLLHTDERGSLFEAVKGRNGGQVFLSTTRPGITRGNHFHIDKVERFLVIKGRATIRLRRVFDDHVLEFSVSGERPEFIDMPTFYTHSITNVGEDELLTLFWSHEIFDVNNPDTFYEPVLVSEE